MQRDRRRKRSHYKDRALRYWLRAVAQRMNLEQLVLADLRGLLIGASHEGGLAEKVAALAPYMIRASSRSRLVKHYPLCKKLYVRLVAMGDGSGYLCAIGDDSHSHQDLEQAEEGIRRILA